MPDLTRCEHPDTGGQAELPTEALPTWERLGWQPISDSRSPEQAELERIEADEEQAALIAGVVADLTADKPATVAEVLEQVGDDPEAAQVALDLELSRDNPRSTLVDGLTKIAADGGQNLGDNAHG